FERVRPSIRAESQSALPIHGRLLSTARSSHSARSLRPNVKDEPRGPGASSACRAFTRVGSGVWFGVFLTSFENLGPTRIEEAQKRELYPGVRASQIPAHVFRQCRRLVEMRPQSEFLAADPSPGRN